MTVSSSKRSWARALELGDRGEDGRGECSLSAAKVRKAKCSAKNALRTSSAAIATNPPTTLRGLMRSRRLVEKSEKREVPSAKNFSRIKL